MNQHEWVYGCYQYYLDNYIEPGNPEDGVWENAHWPVPECKGGTKTIPLLREHHAVHGVLQSNEWNYPCIFGWEKKFLSGDLLARCEYWCTVRQSLASKASANRTPEQRSDAIRRGNASRTPEQRSDAVKKGKAKMTPEQRSEASRKAAASRTPEQRSESARKAAASRTSEQRSASTRQANASRTPEQRSEIARKARAAQLRKVTT